MTYLRCPECRLTAHATAYYLQGDRCPRCLTTMEPAERFRDSAPVPAVAVVEDSRAAGARASGR